MKFKSVLIGLIACGYFFSFLPDRASCAWYPYKIEYQQAVTKILKRGDITWGDKLDKDYKFSSVSASADGSKVLLKGVCEWCNPKETRPFLVDPDGSDVEDISVMLPTDISSRWSGWRNQIINDDASRVFFRAVLNTSYYGDEYIYEYEPSASVRTQAVNQRFGPFGSGWHFRIDGTGIRVYMDKYDGGYSEALGHNMRGLYYADSGGPKQFYFDIYDLTCASQCGNMNLFFLMGTAFSVDRAFFGWNSDYDRTDGSDQHVGFYTTGLDGTPNLIGGEHYFIAAGDTRGICNADGSKVIYRYRHAKGEDSKLGVVNVSSKEERVIAWTSSLNAFSSHMTRSGEYVLVDGAYGDKGSYYKTMIDLKTDTSRDTWSYYLPYRYGSTSNVTADDRYYFYSLDFWPNDSEAVAGVYRVDMKTTGDAKAPYVVRIDFSAPALFDWDDHTISVQATVSDPQGTGNIEWVRLLPLVEGQETPPWSMARGPLAFPSGDAGATYLYDDGTHGDAVAGDGVFSFDSIATRKGDREGENAFNTWYQHYPMPAYVGIRVIVKNMGNHYAIADTKLLICDTDCGQGTIKNQATGASYDTIQAAYDDALDQETLMIQGLSFSGDLVCTDIGDKTVMFEGGYDPLFSDNPSGVTRVRGHISVEGGTVVFSDGSFSFELDQN